MTTITPVNTSNGMQLVTFGFYNAPADEDVYTWARKIILGADTYNLGYNNIGNLVTIS